MRTLAVLSLLAAVVVAEEPKEQAWRAYRIGDSKEQARVPELIALLQAENEIVRDTALDALIRLKAKAPYKVLRPLLDRHKLEVLILLALHPDDKALVEVVERPLSQTQWTLVCNVMAKRRTPGFATHLLAGLEVKLLVTVHDPGNDRFGGRSGGIGGGSGDGRLTVEEGWPPRAYYSLTEYKRWGELLAPGRHNVYVRRKEVKSGTGGIGSQRSSGRRNVRRFEYLQDLLGTPKLPVSRRAYLHVAWDGADDYRRRVRERYAAIQGAYGRLVETCIERKLLDKERAKKLKPIVKIEVNDSRAEQQPPLPELPVR
ncbi:MAG: HEAT repeat domain-containing protein [Planctomycetota bacterium]